MIFWDKNEILASVWHSRCSKGSRDWQKYSGLGGDFWPFESISWRPGSMFGYDFLQLDFSLSISWALPEGIGVPVKGLFYFISSNLFHPRSSNGKGRMTVQAMNNITSSWRTQIFEDLQLLLTAVSIWVGKHQREAKSPMLDDTCALERYCWKWRESLLGSTCPRTPPKASAWIELIVKHTFQQVTFLLLWQCIYLLLTVASFFP